MTDLAKRIWIDFGKSELLNIYKFNWCEAFYSTCSSIFRHLDFITTIWMIFCSFQYGVLLKRGSYVFINSWNSEFCVTLLLRQNKSRYKIWHWLELGCSCQWKQPANKSLAYGTGMLGMYSFLLILSILIKIFHSKTG